MAMMPEFTKRFDKLVSGFLVFLLEANYQHPAVTYNQKRKQDRESSMDRRYNDLSNLQRASKQQRLRTQDRYYYDLAQWQYANQPRKVANHILNTSKRVKLKFEMSALE